MKETHQGATTAKPVEAELMPAEGSNITHGLYLNDDSIRKVNQYHMVAERCGNMSVWCAALAGAELIKKKAELGHGNGFEEWKQSLPFSGKTASHYMKLAERMHDELAKLPRNEILQLAGGLTEANTRAEKAMALLELPSPMDALNPVHEQISRIVQKITGGSTMRQLMFDWGILKPPKPVSVHPSKPVILAPGDSIEHHDAVLEFDRIFSELWMNVRDYKIHLHLDVSDLRRYSNEMLDLKRSFDELIKRG